MIRREVLPHDVTLRCALCGSDGASRETGNTESDRAPGKSNRLTIHAYCVISAAPRIPVAPTAHLARITVPPARLLVRYRTAYCDNVLNGGGALFLLGECAEQDEGRFLLGPEHPKRWPCEFFRDGAERRVHAG